MQRLDQLLPEIDAAVEAALRGEASLETTIARLCFDRELAEDEPPWPHWARTVWRIAIARYRQLADTPLRSPGPSLADVWSGIERLTDGREWWDLRASWPTIAAALGLRGDSNATWHLREVQGWRFRGHSTHREITHAPCVVCGRITPRKRITDRRCPNCTPRKENHDGHHGVPALRGNRGNRARDKPRVLRRPRR